MTTTPNNDIYKEFGERLRAIREDKGLSQTELAQVANMAQTTYSGYERGYRKIKLSVVRQLAEALGVSPDFLLTGAEPGQTQAQELNSLEADLVDKYRKLDSDEQELIASILDNILRMHRKRETEKGGTDE